MGPRRGSAVAVGCALALLLAMAVPSGALAKKRGHRADGRLGDWRGKATMLAGRHQVSRGELIYTDYLYDDYGPDLDGVPAMPPFRSNLSPRSGDHDYPEDAGRYGYNAADLREFRLALDRRRLHALIKLQTLKAKNAPIATIAIDLDGKDSTGSGQLPGGAGLTAAGADRFITVWGTGARLTDSSGGSRALRARTNLAANAIELAVKRRALGRLRRGARAWIVVGLAGDGGTYLAQPGSGTPAFDLAQGPDRYDVTNSHWSELAQADVLAAGELGSASIPLRPRAMRRKRSIPFVLRPGYYNRLFRSRYSYGEGINLKQDSAEGNSDPMFLGRFQTYGLYVPKGYRPNRQTPLLLDGHSLDVNHNEYKAVGFRQLTQLGDQRGSLIITPLARGTDTWYLDSGLIDVFEAWRDVRRHYNADPERTSLTGYSMGGYMTYRLGLLMPDAFVRASVYVGPPLYYQWAYPLPPETAPEWEVAGNTNLIVENGLNLPYEIVHGNLDELVPVTGVQRQADTFEAAGNPYRFYRHSADDHFGFIAFANQWQHTRDWLGRGRRDLSPVEVRYKRYPAMDLRKAGLVFDGAYWVDRLKVRDADQADDFGRIEATTFALGGHRRKLVSEGPAPYVGPEGLTPATVTGQHFVKGDRIKERNAFEATLENLSGVTFRSKRMGLRVGRRAFAQLTGDGIATVRLTGDWDPTSVTLDGVQVPAKQGRRALSMRLDLTAGEPHELVIRRVRTCGRRC